MEAQQLVDIGLLEVIEDNRYTQHNLLRAYAKALMEKNNETDDVFASYANFYVQMTELFQKMPPEQWILLTVDLPNIYNVGDVLVQQTDTGRQGNLDRALFFALNTHLYLYRRRELQRTKWLEMGLNAARAAQDDTDTHFNRATEPRSSFTCTLFWEFAGPRSFETMKNDDDVRRFFDEEFPDAVPLMPTLLEDFRQNPTGSLVTVRCAPWHYQDKVALVGDAAHAVVPFYGQGMNAAFEGNY